MLTPVFHSYIQGGCSEELISYKASYGDYWSKGSVIARLAVYVHRRCPIWAAEDKNARPR